MFKDRLRLLDLLERLGLLNTPQTVIQAVQKALKSAWMREFLVPVALLFDQQLPNLFPRDARIQKRRLELGIGLALGVDQGANRCFECGILLFGSMPTSRREVINAPYPGLYLTYSFLHGRSRPPD